MITLGIDLAAEPKKTGIARLDWGSDVVTITDVETHASDEDLLTAMTEAEKTGIDCPLGWPVKFIDFISRHQQDHVDVVPGLNAQDWRRQLAYRVTDLKVKQLGIQGLSVSTDRIGVTTMRCAALLSMLAAQGRPVDRTGAGSVVEVYPAASLLIWKLPHRGYKQKKGLARLDEAVDALLKAAPWLDMGMHANLCRASDDAFDAVIAALTAGAAANGHVETIPDADRSIAAVEGWIALPTTGLASIGPSAR